MKNAIDSIKEMSKGFNKFYIRSSMTEIRIGLGVSTIFFALFGFFDPGQEQLLIRFGIIIPVMIVTLAATYSKWFTMYWQPVLAAAYVAISLGLIYMIRITDPSHEAREVYTIGLTLCIIGSSAIRLRKGWTIVSTAVILLVFVVVTPLRHDIYLHFPVFLTAAFITILYISSTERILKDNYATFIILNEERKTLKSIKEELEESDSLKSKLLSIIAHDLKGPTNTVASILDLLNSKKITPEEFDLHAGKLKVQLQGNQMLLENLLKWSLMKTDSRANLTKVNIHALVEECIDLLRESASRKGNDIKNAVEETYIMTDPDIIKMVIRNLLSNSIKFTAAGTVVCSSKLANDEFSITVQDSGSGMPKENADRLFNWNKRISTLGTSNERGSGIGLLICAEFLKSLGGTIRLYTTPGKGTSVTIGLGNSLVQS